MSGFISRLCLLQVVSPVTPCVSQSFHISHYFILRVSNALISLHFTSKRLEQRAVEYHVIPVICVRLLMVSVSNEVIVDVWVAQRDGVSLTSTDSSGWRDGWSGRGEEEMLGWLGCEVNRAWEFKKKLKLKSQLMKDVSWLTCLFLTFSFYSLPDTNTASLLFGCILINTLCLPSTCPSIHPSVPLTCPGH